MHRQLLTVLALASVFLAACDGGPHEPADTLDGAQRFATTEQTLIDCTEHTDTGYVSGTPFTITVVTVDGKPAERDTANAYWVMQQAAAQAGVSLQIVSGFRTWDQQNYLYGCYINCSCNNCNLAARPGYSNHQSGHALDLNTSAPGVLDWLNNHGAAYGFRRTVPSENWHWEWWGGGPGGGPCGACEPHCEGSVVVDRQCGRGDCGVFGSGCVDDAQGPRCVFYACPPTGDVAVCLDDTIIGNCSNGAISTGDCGAFAAYCSTAGAQQARCVSIFCVDGPQQVPEPHDGCWLDGSLAHCDANGALSVQACPAGQTCNVFPQPHCESDLPCPPGNDIWACIDDTVRGRCWGGGVIEAEDCGAVGGYCSTAGGGEPRCVSALCVSDPSESPTAHDVCLLDGALGHCSADGQVEPELCPEGQTCYDDGSGALCVDLYCGDKLGVTGCTEDGQLFTCDELGGLSMSPCAASQHCSWPAAACVDGVPCGPGAKSACVDATTRVDCQGGVVLAQETCAQPSVCGLLSDGEAGCVAPEPSTSDVPSVGRPDGYDVDTDQLDGGADVTARQVDAGCACRITRRTPSPWPLLAGVTLVGWLGAWRRRTQPDP